MRLGLEIRQAMLSPRPALLAKSLSGDESRTDHLCQDRLFLCFECFFRFLLLFRFRVLRMPRASSESCDRDRDLARDRLSSLNRGRDERSAPPTLADSPGASPPPRHAGASRLSRDHDDAWLFVLLPVDDCRSSGSAVAAAAAGATPFSEPLPDPVRAAVAPTGFRSWLPPPRLSRPPSDNLLPPLLPVSLPAPSSDSSSSSSLSSLRCEREMDDEEVDSDLLVLVDPGRLEYSSIRSRESAASETPCCA